MNHETCHMIDRRRTLTPRAVLAVVLGTLLVALGSLASPAGAAGRSPAAIEQTSCDPAYGCPPGTPPPPPSPACALSVDSAAPGTAVTASVTNAGGGASVRVTFDGVEVGSAVTANDGSASIRWQVPQAPNGPHQVFAVGGDFNVQCGPFTVFGGVQVAGESFTRGTGTGGTGVLGGSLARTGLQIALLVAVAVVLILLGWQLARLARHQRRRAVRRRNKVRDLSEL